MSHCRPSFGVLMSELIDTTEMYLRTIVELEEEGVPPMRARIAERLNQSGPTVSQTVARMERDGLLIVDDERHLQLTDLGRRAATRVMRKHRLAECLLVDVIGLPWEQVHAEACRWEHVISDEVERRLLVLLGNPTSSPFGNPIPALDDLDRLSTDDDLAPLTDVAQVETRWVVVQRLAEPIQDDAETMASLRRAGVLPGASVKAHRSAGGVSIGSGGEYVELVDEVAVHVLVALP